MTEESRYPSEAADRFQVRLPDGMRDRIKAAAAANNRSMNAEIVATLEEKYPPPKFSPALSKLAETMVAAVAEVVERGGQSSDITEVVKDIVSVWLSSPDTTDADRDALRASFARSDD